MSFGEGSLAQSNAKGRVSLENPGTKPPGLRLSADNVLGIMSSSHGVARTIRRRWPRLCGTLPSMSDVPGRQSSPAAPCSHSFLDTHHNSVVTGYFLVSSSSIAIIAQLSSQLQKSDGLPPLSHSFTPLRLLRYDVQMFLHALRDKRVHK